MFSIPVIVLVALAVLLLLPPLLRLRIARLKLGPYLVALSRPLDFGSLGPAAASLTLAGACLVIAAALAGVLPEGAPQVTPTPPQSISGGFLATQPAPTVTPLHPEEFTFAQVDEATGRVAIRLLQPDTMAGWTVSEDSPDFDLEVLAESMTGPINSVACVAFRVTGQQLRPREHYRPSGSGAWPTGGYMYCVSHVGLWSLARFDNGRPTYLREYQEARNIRQIKANKLRIRAEGSTLQLWLNDAEMARVTDPSYTTGPIQLTCSTPPDELPAAACNFEGLQITPLP